MAERLPNDWTMSVAGQGNEEEKLRKEIRENNNGDKLILLGALNDKGLKKHYLNF